ncbi:MAG: aconitate hydratase, partial [Methanosarcinales archaeon]|nr:aconitate hydratase [Methanosarcinales archaeon]
SFARIHKANLVNFGILPLEFADKGDHDAIEQGSVISIDGIRELVESDAREIPATVDGKKIILILDISKRQRNVLLAGGLLNHTKQMVRE